MPSKKSSLVGAFSATRDASDEVDAHAVALAALATPGLEQVRTDDHTRRCGCSHHAAGAGRCPGSGGEPVASELQILIPGGAKRHLSAGKAKTLLASVLPATSRKVRKALALEQLADLVRIDARLAEINKAIKAAVKAAPTTLPTLRGVGPVITAIVLGEVRDVARFADADHFASYNGSAPTTWGSAGDARPA